MIVIFDWDGTLCDSVDSIVAAMQAAAVELALPVPDPAAIRNIVGLGLDEAISLIMPGLGPDQRLQVAQAYSQHYVSLTQEPAPLFAGARELLELLREQGMELAVATGKSRRGLDRVLAGLGMEGFFDATRCADETLSKPDPLMLRQILSERGKTPTEAVMVGDTEYDLAMAQALGMPSVGVSFGVHSPERLARLNPLGIIDTLLALPAILTATAATARSELS